MRLLREAIGKLEQRYPVKDFQASHMQKETLLANHVLVSTALCLGGILVGLWIAGHGRTSLSSISLSLSPFLLPFFVSSTPLVLRRTGFLTATQAVEMEGSSTGRKEGFKASERYPGRYPERYPYNGENSPLPVMRWGSHHPFFCFLPPLICSSFLSLSRPLVKYLQDETASKRAFLQDSSR